MTSGVIYTRNISSTRLSQFVVGVDRSNHHWAISLNGVTSWACPTDSAGCLDNSVARLCSSVRQSKGLAPFNSLVRIGSCITPLEDEVGQLRGLVEKVRDYMG